LKELSPLAQTLNQTQKEQLTKVLMLFKVQVQNLDNQSTLLLEQVETLNSQLQESKKLSETQKQELTRLSISLSEQESANDWKLMGWTTAGFFAGWAVGLVLHF